MVWIYLSVLTHSSVGGGEVVEVVEDQEQKNDKCLPRADWSWSILEIRHAPTSAVEREESDLK